MKYTARKRSTDIVVSVVAIALGLVLIFPVIYCVLGAFKTPAEFLSPRLLPSSFAYTQNFRDAMHQAPMLRYMLNSLIMATLGTVVRLVFLILGTMMMPGDTLLITNYVTVSRLGLLNTYLGMCITGFVSASQMFMLRQKFLSVPKDLRYAAMIDGCGDLRYILTILMPICKPIITTLFVQSFITIWNAYLWPLIITASAPDMRTIMVGITKLNSWEDTNYQLVLAGVTISLIPSFILFVIMRRNMAKGGTEGSLVG